MVHSGTKWLCHFVGPKTGNFHNGQRNLLNFLLFILDSLSGGDNSAEVKWNVECEEGWAAVGFGRTFNQVISLSCAKIIQKHHFKLINDHMFTII